jgi:hypothetical protein
VEGGRKRNVDFVKIGFTGQTDFVVRYLANNNGLSSSNNQFRFKGNVVIVNRIGEHAVCSVSLHQFFLLRAELIKLQ